MNECFNCGATAETQKHHVVPSSLGGEQTVNLCLNCHSKVHGKTMSTSELTKRGQEKRYFNWQFHEILAQIAVLDKIDDFILLNHSRKQTAKLAEKVVASKSFDKKHWEQFSSPVKAVAKRLVRLYEIASEYPDYFEEILEHAAQQIQVIPSK